MNVKCIAEGNNG